MSAIEAKRASARRALAEIEEGSILGVGTGSTVDLLIELLAEQRHLIEGAVSSSERSSERLRALGIPVLDLNAVGPLPLYIDGADECDRQGRLIKGGGAALTREKIVASASERFVCIIDQSKEVECLGRFPLPLEVIPMARSLVGRAVVKLGGVPVWREGVVTDNGHWILDVVGLDYSDPDRLEAELNQIPGLISNGLFCQRRADLVVTDGVARVPLESEGRGPRAEGSGLMS
jgi:ribose 5-phosphate isomerase A